MKKIFFYIFIIINVLFFNNCLSYSVENFSLYGVSIGDSYDEVKENANKRGYSINESNNLNLSVYTKNLLIKLLNKDLYEKISNINEKPFDSKISFNDIESNYFGENIFRLSYEEDEKLVNLDIYFIKDNNQLNVFLIIANSNIKSIIQTFNKRYGNSKIKEYKSEGWGSDSKFNIWENGNIIALGDFDLSNFIIVDTSELNDIFETIYDDYIFENNDKERKEKELQMKRDEEI